MYLPEQKVHLVLSALWLIALIPLYIFSGSLIASTALMITILCTITIWPLLLDIIQKSENDFISFWVGEYKFYRFYFETKAIMALKNEKKQRKVSY